MFHHTILKGEKSFLIRVNKVFLVCIKHQHQIFTAVIPALCLIDSVKSPQKFLAKKHSDVTMFDLLISKIQAS